MTKKQLKDLQAIRDYLFKQGFFPWARLIDELIDNWQQEFTAQETLNKICALLDIQED